MTLHLLPTQKDWAASPETVFSGEVEWPRGCPLGKYEVHYQTKLKGIGHRMERLPIRPLEFGGQQTQSTLGFQVLQQSCSRWGFDTSTIC